MGMQTSGIFRTGRKVIPYDGNEIQLVPIGDIHYGCANHAKNAFARWIKEVKKLSNPYFFGMGDYFDALSSSERTALRRADFHDQTYIMLNETAKRREKELLKKISFMKDRMIGMLGGNHEWEYQSGACSTDVLAEELGCQHLGVATLFNLTLERGNKRSPLIIHAHHGKGSGATIGSSLNGVAKGKIGFDADLHLMGHDHKLVGGYETRVRLSPAGKLVEKVIWSGRTGNFLKGYPEGVPSYPVDANYLPAPLGGVFFHLHQRTTRERGLHVSATADAIIC